MKAKLTSFYIKHYPTLVFYVIGALVCIAYSYRVISFNDFISLGSFQLFVTSMLLSYQSYKEKHITSSKILFAMGMISFIAIYFWYNS
ncbi:MAG: hypothetical protein RR641_01010 [Erysipelotrichaceae bacterium]